MNGQPPLSNGSMDQHSNDHQYYFDQPPPLVSIETLVCSILLALTGLVSLVGNGLMLRAWIKYPRLRNDFYTVFAALSIADILYVVIGVPFAIIEMDPNANPLASLVVCKFQGYTINALGFVTATLLVILSTLRAILLTNRNTLPRPRAKHLVVISLICFVVIFLISIPTTSMYTMIYGLCYLESNINDTEIWLLHCFSTFVPLVLVAILYFIAYTLGKRFFSDSYTPRETQKSRLVTAVVLAFIITQVPYRTFLIYLLYIDPEDLELQATLMTIKDFLLCLLMVDKAVRPILCSKLTTDLARGFDEIINCQGCQTVCGHKKPSPRSHIVAGPETVQGAEGGEDIMHSTDGACAIEDFEEIEYDEQPSPLANYPDRSRSGVDRSISTSSTASTNSQVPLIRNHSNSSESEKNGNSVV